MSVVVFLFSILRYNVGWDYMAYYDTIMHNFDSSLLSRNEVISTSLIIFSRKIGSANFYFIVNSVITVFLIAFVLHKNSPDPFFSFFIFITFPLFFLNSLSIVRNFTAIAIVFYSLRFINEGRLLRYVVMIMIASGFHTSALIALLFYPLKFLNINSMGIIIMIVSGSILRPLLSSELKSLFPILNIYLKRTSDFQGWHLIFFFVFILFLVVVFRNNLAMGFSNRDANLLVNIFTLGVVIYILFFDTGTLGHRLSLYGIITSTLIIPKLVDIFSNKRERILFKFVLCSGLMFLFFATIYLGSSTYIPYETILGK
jgi:hypothetical protein